MAPPRAANDLKAGETFPALLTIQRALCLARPDKRYLDARVTGVIFCIRTTILDISFEKKDFYSPSASPATRERAPPGVSPRLIAWVRVRCLAPRETYFDIFVTMIIDIELI